VFVLQRPVNLPVLFNFSQLPNQVALYQAEVDRSAQQLVAMCVALGEHPYVRYSARSKLTQDIAQRVEVSVSIKLQVVTCWGKGYDWG
jgi:hypothetical protein